MNEYESFVKEHAIKEIDLNYRTPFRCKQCGDCCRHVPKSIQLDSIDAYRIAQYLRAQGDPAASMETVYSEYAEPVMLDMLPAFMLKSKGVQEECVFLDGCKCSIHPVKPHVCKLHPFSVVPAYTENSLLYFICREQPHHFRGNTVSAGEWMKQNLRLEDREFFLAQNRTTLGVASLLRAVNAESELYWEKVLPVLLHYLYFAFRLDLPFMPQYWENHRRLTNELTRISTSAK